MVRKATDPPLRWLPGHQAMGETARQLNLRGPQSVVMTRTCRAAELPLGKVLSDPQRRIPLDVTRALFMTVGGQNDSRILLKVVKKF